MALIEMERESNAVQVKVRWRGKELEVEIDASEPPEVFKLQVFSLTGVPPDRQTILGFKGGKLKDGSDWSKVGLKKNMKIMLMGTPVEESVMHENVVMPKVRNDLGDNAMDEEYEEVPAHPPGLTNLGNTCYMNATVQCLKSVGKLANVLREYRGSTRALNPSERLAAGLRDLVSRLNAPNAKSINPLSFLTTLRQVNPVFAERGQNGMPIQQDAEECWCEILTNLSLALAAPNVERQSERSGEDPIDRMFGIKMKSTDRCEESEVDEPVIREDTVRTLKCHISSSVNHLNQGIKENLEETIEKRSEALDRMAKWRRTSQIKKLPPYLIVQFVRFFWKASERVKAKILRQVSFPVNLDVYDFCTNELKHHLSKNRNTAEEERTTPIMGESKDDEESADTATTSAPASSQKSAQADLPKPSGVYELCAVLTHKGRAADTGHYVAWVKESDKNWLKYDDDRVSVHTEEEVKKLSGGGDWHMAYMCLYRIKGLES